MEEGVDNRTRERRRRRQSEPPPGRDHEDAQQEDNTEGHLRNKLLQQKHQKGLPDNKERRYHNADGKRRRCRAD